MKTDQIVMMELDFHGLWYYICDNFYQRPIVIKTNQLNDSIYYYLKLKNLHNRDLHNSVTSYGYVYDGIIDVLLDIGLLKKTTYHDVYILKEAE